ncbi:ClpP/crotonase-like domain-containing protein [Mycena vulgaris]|nr:ClpP/crotonase-like domain-containing protein [Mycena vulgaris]
MFRALLSFSTLTLLASYASAARYPSYGTLQTTKSAGVLNVVINNTFSEINLFDQFVQSDLGNLIETLQANDTDSPLPFFDASIPELTFPVALLWNITQLPQATIAVIEGRARGIGNEFLMSCDMRFASTSPSVLLSQLEPSFGANPGSGGAMYLAHEIGRGRTFEYVLPSADVDAVTAAQIGWINRAFATSRELHAHVQALAARIALFPAAGIAGTKQGINAASRPALDVIIRDAQKLIEVLAATPAVQAFAKKFLVATHNQSSGPFELNYGAELVKLYN